MTILDLRPKERVMLGIIAGRTSNARQLRRAQVLIWLDDGERVEEVAERLGVSRRTIYYWVERFVSAGEGDVAGRLLDAPRGGRPPTASGIIDPVIDQIIDTDPRDYGYRSTVWAAPLLRQYLREAHGMAVCQRSVSYALERLDIRWKRPRHDLSRCSPTWRQAKGGSNAGCGRASAP